ncbi:MAG: hypothetical protein IPH31_26295 [Lewinellaceae bacterium]|nr:hypothetical protein [Lewinellaceae bacterium]
MKRTFFFSQGRQSLLALFFLLGGMLLTADRLAAQSYNWMSESLALNTLEVEIDQQVLDLTNYTPGSTPYKNIMNHIIYYKHIHNGIEEGSTVQQAVDGSLAKMNDEFNTTSGMLNKTTLSLLYEDAVQLLTN